MACAFYRVPSQKSFSILYSKNCLLLLNVYNVIVYKMTSSTKTSNLVIKEDESPFMHEISLRITKSSQTVVNPSADINYNTVLSRTASEATNMPSMVIRSLHLLA